MCDVKANPWVPQHCDPAEPFSVVTKGNFDQVYKEFLGKHTRKKHEAKKAINMNVKISENILWNPSKLVWVMALREWHSKCCLCYVVCYWESKINVTECVLD